MFNQDIIQQFIPHRPPFLLIDQITNIKEFETAESILRLEPHTWYFQGHFPHNPVFPGVLSLEFMGQTASFLITYSNNQPSSQQSVYLMSLAEAKFRYVAKPGDTLTCHIKLLRRKGNIFKLHGDIYIDETLSCSADCMLMLS